MSRIVVDGKFLRTAEGPFLIKGVTYGTFVPDANGVQYPDRATVARDFRAMVDASINTVRVYTPPPPDVMDLAAAAGLRLIIGLPWTQHVAFLDDQAMTAAIRRQLVAQARELSAHPATLLLALGNEIPPAIVRWHGRKRTERFLRELCDEVRSAAPDALLTYVNYPPTDYLDLSCFDVCAFNVYLHRERDLRAYLARLQNIAGPRPLLLAEAGADSLSEGEDEQAGLTARHLVAAFEEGACGAVAFAWTDEWWRGGSDVVGWDFGLVDRERREKPALAAVTRVFQSAPFSSEARHRWPRVSVVVCAYNAADTIDECLASLERLDYPDYEVILVNDGSTDSTGEIAGRHPSARVLSVQNAGLSAARNIGLENATGDIVAYTDADVIADDRWLSYLVQPFLASDVVASGGPNMVPADDCRVAQCVARAPGGPTHVLLDDRTAEHVPGCNMAFRRDALMAIGGFDPQFLRAGDDVDVCWRLQAQGWRIGFAPSALVWHRHRSTVSAFWRQQVGYGEGESWLRAKHPRKFIGAQMLWHGRVYSPLPFVRALYRDSVFTGRWGTASFPSVYNVGAASLPFLPLTPAWIVATLIAMAGGVTATPLSAFAGSVLVVAGLVMSAITASRALALSARVHFPGATFADRLLVTWLHVLQPLARVRGRILGWRVAPAASDPVENVPALSYSRALLLMAGFRVQRGFWTERWIALPHVLHRLIDCWREQRSMKRIDVDDGWQQRWDVAAPLGVWARLETRMLIEEHAGGACLVRTACRVKATRAGFTALATIVAAVGAAAWLQRVGSSSIAFALIVAGIGLMAAVLGRIARAAASFDAALDDTAAACQLADVSRTRRHAALVPTRSAALETGD